MSNLNATFNKAMFALKVSAADMSANIVASSAPKWFDLGSGELSKLMNRDGTSKMYADALQPGVGFRAAQIAKIQGDVLSSIERDANMRYRSRVRMFSHSAARYATHGLAEGPAVGNIIGFVRVLMDKQD